MRAMCAERDKYMTPAEYRKKLEEELSGISEWPEAKQMIAYRLLHLASTNCRMDGIEMRIDASVKRGCDNGS